MEGSSMVRRALVALLLAAAVGGQTQREDLERVERARAVWRQSPRPMRPADVQQLRSEAWNMFDHGYSSYMRHAFPLDTLLPISCRGEVWQAGIGLTLIDSLDTLLLMNRPGELAKAVELLRQQVSFDKDDKVHVFETTIRGLGGLLSAHVLLQRDPSLVPGYDGHLLAMAIDLADRMLPAFNSASGLPGLFVHLRGGLLPQFNNTCTACAGTLLLEFGILSRLTGNPVYLQKAEHAARVLYKSRSNLGLVGSGFNIHTHQWTARDSTIGPGADSYYEYLLKAYLMLGKKEYLDMFAQLYGSTQRYMQVPGTVKGYAFLVDVSMDSGRLVRPYISSLGAFWPGMQALVGQQAEAIGLHANYTAAWRQYGWLPEAFGLDLARVQPEDPGYKLRPEHVESTYLLHAITQDERYLQVAANVQALLQTSSRVGCGYAGIRHVQKGEQEDVMESFFLSETVKYLYLTFSNASDLIDYHILSTEGHLVPPFAHDEEVYLTRPPPPNCLALCRSPSAAAEAAARARLTAAFPSVPFSAKDAELIRHRRCIACAVVTEGMEAQPPVSAAERAVTMRIPAEFTDPGTPQAAAAAAAAHHDARQEELRKANTQLIGRAACALVTPSPHNPQLPFYCQSLQPLSIGANALPLLAVNVVVLNLLQQGVPEPPPALLAVADEQGRLITELEASPASFGPALPTMPSKCHDMWQSVGEEGQEAPPGIRACAADAAPLFGPRQSSANGGYTAWQGRTPCANASAQLSGALAAALPLDGCRFPANPGEVYGSIVLVLRGECSFLDKVTNMEAAGALAVIVVNNRGGGMVAMSGDSSGRQPAIPAVLIEQREGRELLRRLAAAQALAATLWLQPPQVIGPDTQYAYHNRIELLIPGAAKPWLQQKLADTGTELQGLLEAILSDNRPQQLLWASALKNIEAARKEEAAAAAAAAAGQSAAAGGEQPAQQQACDAEDVADEDDPYED